MRERGFCLRPLVLLLFLAFVSASTGCTYLKHRGEDFAEMFDIGLTLSGRPSLAVYACGASVVSLGFSRFDGVCLGMAGGQLGAIRHKNVCYGRGLLGREAMLWGEGRSKRQYSQNQGRFGVLGSGRLPGPAYCPACVHFLHIGFMGVVVNARYAEMLDFIIGFTTLDIACDDGRKVGKWFWQ